MLEQFQNHITNNLPFLKESKLLIAISGGLDSIVLTHLCYTLKFDITLAHCNFSLRGNESDQDENFVLEFAKTLNLEAFVEAFNTESYAETEKISIQMAARELRYLWFSDVAESLNFDYILTAHHADDNLETFLINLTRGTGLNGLTGIPEINDNIVRPLLPFSRDELERYTNKINLKWREDSSNASDKYLRNKLRHQVIPHLKEANPELLQNFKKTLQNLNDSIDIVDESVEEVLNRAIASVDEYQITYKISEFKKLNSPRAYLYEIFKDYGFTEWNDVIDLLDAQSGKQVLSKTHRLIKNRARLILTDLCHSEQSKESFDIKTDDKTCQLPIGTLFFDEVDAISESSKTIIFVDNDKLEFPLHIRQWENGDIFHPQGMNGKKKLSKYFKDEKLSLTDKEKVWLLTSEDKIVWVIGMRTDSRFKITEKTNHILKIEIK
ncbi:tRNA lysidine(34) synthetase TilS [Psychroserpens ponticola]|uniref:tRNA(Ile)-lysidine synthase n=1 Tax=Psychroserpens ponticola TaxID=2932268 RepID=A0ABY7RUJ0_9FLAO|nr:tRNA lysidine(34) synthetase TilS [Psychroserpens ponticola]WCO00437.1 tRNA lysidine(34) synthetase TilS [Psychroserpens ponticola]